MSELTTVPYCGPAPLPETWLGAWNLDPFLLAALTGIACAGALILRQAQSKPKRQQAFTLAIGGMFLAFVTPLCALTVALFAARTVHHLVLLCLVAPALAVAFPVRRIPVGAAFLATSAALWAWHVPAVYAVAWESAAVYWAMQAALLLPAWAFWSAIRAAGDDAMDTVGAALLVATLAGQMGLIGAILTFGGRVLYPEHLVGAEGFGFSALDDQQLAGLIMWVPGMVPLGILGAILLRRAWRQGLSA
jgi:putative membrane protein